MNADKLMRCSLAEVVKMHLRGQITTETLEAYKGAKYQARVESGLTGLRYVSVGSSEDCAECNGRSDDGHFSHSGCGICGQIAGQRYNWHAVDSDNEVIHFDDACTDCVQYIANGTMPKGTR